MWEKCAHGGLSCGSKCETHKPPPLSHRHCLSLQFVPLLSFQEFPDVYADTEEAQPHLTVPQFPPRWGCSGRGGAEMPGHTRAVTDAALTRERGWRGSSSTAPLGHFVPPGNFHPLRAPWLQGRGASLAGAARHRGGHPEPLLLSRYKLSLSLRPQILFFCVCNLSPYSCLVWRGRDLREPTPPHKGRHRSGCDGGGSKAAELCGS